ncbi:hypothetical protein DACRYDRAFT_108472 [Dacryopinax primogenitus]|uniref:F-box domain-containing protein n=1 Tax=Dacryopinax primogenitus (strain DJM 731) TaxID=1858805 RepID=M5FTZ0_DACPD|nr:uncharacterized protein DACRYDRAFT_108472 [Dacryopinax primogenitus]EJU01141.1 hypothetical protein DACRYDRAFT_108472 [Dacryopinax primogenitus]
MSAPEDPCFIKTSTISLLPGMMRQEERHPEELIELQVLSADLSKLKLCHVLVLNLGLPVPEIYPRYPKRRDDVKMIDFEGSDIPPYPILKLPISHAYAGFLARIREIVRITRLQADFPAIDAISIQGMWGKEPWDIDLCNALDGLHPRVLDIDYLDNNLNLTNFSQLRSPFSLEWLIIRRGYYAEVIFDSESLACPYGLQLFWCFAVTLHPIPGPSALRHLILTGNDARESFGKMRYRTNLLDNLEVLTIESYNGSDFPFDSNPNNFFSALHATSTLRILGLSFGIQRAAEMNKGLPAHLPDQIETFTFRYHPALISNTAPWLTCINNQNWLPNLKKLSLFPTMPFKPAN